MNHYKDRLEKIEAILFKTMPPSCDRQWIERAAGPRSKDLGETTANRFNAPGLELLNRGGKRWRPLVMVLMGEAAGGSDELYELTPLVELPHNGSLVVDDIEDRSEERRGGPAVHMIHGEDISINCGNLMYFLPTYLIDLYSGDEGKKYRIFRAYSGAMRRLHFGQGMDIQWHRDHDFIPQREEYLQMTRFKTGCLSSLAAKLALIEAGCDDSLVTLGGAIWEDIGVGFQILDDVMNVSKGNPGKMRGDDIVEGKKSLPLILHCGDSEKKKNQMNDLFHRAAAGGGEAYIAVEEAISLMEGSGSIEKAGKEGLALLEGGKEALSKLYPSSEAVPLMIEIIDGFIEKML